MCAVTLTDTSEAYRFLFFFKFYFIHAGWRHNFGRLAIPGKFHRCSKFSPFALHGFFHGLLEFQTLINGFVILYTLIDVSYFFSSVLEYF